MRRGIPILLLLLAACDSQTAEKPEPFRPLTATEDAAATAWGEALRLCLNDQRLSFDGAAWGDRRAQAEQSVQKVQFAMGRFVSAVPESGREGMSGSVDALKKLSRIAADVASACAERNEELCALHRDRLATHLDDLRGELVEAGLFQPSAEKRSP
jgi:hypothetical protein